MGIIGFYEAVHIVQWDTSKETVANTITHCKRTLRMISGLYRQAFNIWHSHHRASRFDALLDCVQTKWKWHCVYFPPKWITFNLMVVFTPSKAKHENKVLCLCLVWAQPQWHAAFLHYLAFSHDILNILLPSNGYAGYTVVSRLF